MATLLPQGKQYFEASDGSPLAGGKLYTYDAGTNTPRVTYADADGTIPNTNPIILDARGEAVVFWSGSYKVVLRDAADGLIWTVNQVADSITLELAPSASGRGADLIGLYGVTGFTNLGAWARGLGFVVSSQPANAWRDIVVPQVGATYVDNVLTLQNRSINGGGQYGNAAIRFKDAVTGYERAAIGYSGSGDAPTSFIPNTAYIEIGNLSPDTQNTSFRLISTFLAGSASFPLGIQYFNMQVDSDTGNIQFRCPTGTQPDFTVDLNPAVGFLGTSIRQSKQAMKTSYLRIRERDGDDILALTTNVDTGTTKDNTGLTAWRVSFGANDQFRVSRMAVGSSSWVDLFRVLGDNGVSGATVTTTVPITLPVYATASLPNPAAPYQRAFVNDSSVTTFNTIVAGGGANRVPVFSDGTNWRVG